MMLCCISLFSVFFILNFSWCREMPLAELKSKYRKNSSLEKARSGWEAEYEASSKQVWILDEPN